MVAIELFLSGNNILTTLFPFSVKLAKLSLFFNKLSNCSIIVPSCLPFFTIFINVVAPVSLVARFINPPTTVGINPSMAVFTLSSFSPIIVAALLATSPTNNSFNSPNKFITRFLKCLILIQNYKLSRVILNLEIWKFGNLL